MKIKNFTDLHAWKKAHELALEVYKVSKEFPQSERFSLTSQIQRSAISVPSNIAEGFGRSGRKEKQRFYTIARGSLYELQAQLVIAKDLDYLAQEQYVQLEEKSVVVAKLISGLISSAVDRVDTRK